MGAFLTQGHAQFSSECGFMAGVVKPKLCTKFEAIVLILKGNPKFREAPIAQNHTHFFF